MNISGTLKNAFTSNTARRAFGNIVKTKLSTGSEQKDINTIKNILNAKDSGGSSKNFGDLLLQAINPKQRSPRNIDAKTKEFTQEQVKQLKSKFQKLPETIDNQNRYDFLADIIVKHAKETNVERKDLKLALKKIMGETLSTVSGIDVPKS